MERKRQSLPRVTDWNRYNAQLGAPITRVRHQGSTGSCWVHSAFGALEANHNLLNLKLHGAGVTPFYTDYSNGLNCLQMRNELTGANPRLATHPAEFEMEIQCALPAPAVSEGRCGITLAYERFGQLIGQFGEQYGVYLEAQMIDVQENRWKLGSGLVTLGQWRNVPNYESFEARRDAAFQHFVSSYTQGFNISPARANCQLLSALPYRAIGDGGFEPRTFDFVAEQQRCLRHSSAGGEVDGECVQMEDGVYAYAPTMADEFREASDDTFNAERCTLSSADTGGIDGFSRFWTLAATWDRMQELPNVDGFVSQKPYWQSYGPMEVYESGDTAALQRALLSLMATLDHGPTTGVIQTCNGFMDYKAAAHGRPIHFPACDVMQAPKADECDPSENGLHAIVVIGYYFVGFHRPLEESYFEIVNSYGLEWGVQGHARLAMGHFMMSQFSLPLIRDPQRLINPFLPAIDPTIAYSLPPTLFIRPSGVDVAVSANKLAIFPLDNGQLTLDVTKMLPDVAITAITFQFASAVPADLRATLTIGFTDTPANRQQLPGVSVGTFTTGNNANAIVFAIPQAAATVPASSWWATVAIQLQSRTPQINVLRITYSVDATKSGAFLSDDTLKTDSAAAALAPAALAAVLAAAAATVF
jgi:hypothetical protein